MVNFGFLHSEMVRYELLNGCLLIAELFFVLAHKVTEVQKGSEEVNVSFSNPEHQSCM
jgi:hypothetical protein